MNPNPEYKTPQIKNEKDYLWLHLRALPYFRSLMRAEEASFYSRFELPEPVLDVGSGDGHFATVAFDQPLDVGVDPWWEPTQEAAKLGGYKSLVQADAGVMPFPDAHFGSALSNSVLEHIPHVQEVLNETARVLQPGAPFVFCGPNQRFLSALSVGNFLDQVGLHALGDSYRAFFNRISRHYNDDTPQVWQERLEKAGFEVLDWWYYYAPQALQVTEWGHYFGLPSLIWKKLTGRWILVPTRWNLVLTYRYTKAYFDPAEQPDGVCTFFIARRKS